MKINIDDIRVIAVEYGPGLIGALLVLVLGLWVIRIVTRAFGRFLNNRKIEESLKPFLRTLINILLKVLLFISVLGMLDVEMTSFIAILGAAGLAVGLALSGTLQNFAGGVLILLLKPYKVGDFIDALGYSGTVAEIQIFNTILKTPDNKTIILPNGSMVNTTMTNFSTQETRRVDWTFGIAYGEKVEKAEEIIHNLIKADERVLADPAPFSALSAMADSSVNIVVRVWVKSSDYWGVFFDLNRNVYNAFNKEGISIPFPQMDVHLLK
jgi:small conductance mechanosensitive channel